MRAAQAHLELDGLYQDLVNPLILLVELSFLVVDSVQDELQVRNLRLVRVEVRE